MVNKRWTRMENNKKKKNKDKLTNRITVSLTKSEYTKLYKMSVDLDRSIGWIIRKAIHGSFKS